MKLRTLILAVTGAAALAASPALAASEIFTVVNSTGYDIREVYVAPTRNDSWEEDVLGADVLEDGQRTRIDFSRSEDACLWDMKVVYTDDDEAVWQGLDLCEISTVVLHYNHNTGRTWADTD